MKKLITIWLSAVAVFSVVHADEAETSSNTPVSFVKFSAEPDNKCMQRSPKGRRMFVSSSHPDKEIKYRFIRIFANKKQPGLNSGILKPGEKPQALGCTVIDGREQHWEIHRVTFVEAST